jgi:hypothetical protein
MSMNRKIKLILHPLWQYLNQSILDHQSIWNLNHFWYLYKIQLLRRCWNKQASPKSNPYY